VTRGAWLACALAGCAAPATVAPARAPAAATTTPLAAVLAASVCPAVEGRAFSLASGEDGVLDTYVLVKRCRARAERDEVAVAADAYGWLAVDRDFGAVAVRAFVHATAHAELRVRVSARDDGKRLQVTLAPLGRRTLAIEPVGVLDPAPQNLAALFAVEIAPSLGVSPEALAKTRLKEEALRTLEKALAKPLVVSYDARMGATWAGTGPRRYRIVPHGTAAQGPFPPTQAPLALAVRSPSRVAVRAACVSHLEHLIDADRRGDRVAVDDWNVVEGEAKVAVAPMPCSWMAVLRATDDAASVVEVDVPAVAPAGSETPRAADRWVSIDEMTIDPPLADPLLAVVAATGVREHHAGARGAIMVLAPDEDVRLRIVRRERAARIVEAEEKLAFDGPGDFARDVVLATKDARARTTVHVRARVRLAEER
jgi:hypothetical protein